MLKPSAEPTTSLGASRSRGRTLSQAIAEYRRMQARCKTAWANYDAVSEADASPRHVEKVHELLVELADLSRQLDLARRDVLGGLLRQGRRKRALRRISRILVAAFLSAGSRLVIRGCSSPPDQRHAGTAVESKGGPPRDTKG